MTYLIFVLCVLLSIAISSLAVTVKEDGKEVDCSVPCACCRVGRKKCGKSRCYAGCIDTVYGQRCEHLCKGNCYTCHQFTGSSCTTCKDIFYDIDSSCGKNCSVGCIGGKCNNQDGTCSCRELFTGGRCDACVDGRYGSTCDQVCSVACATPSCDKTTGSCECRAHFAGNKCDKCSDEFAGCAEVFAGSRCGTVSKTSISVELFTGMLVVGVTVAVVATVVVLLLIKRFKRQKANNASSNGIKSSNSKTDLKGIKNMYEDLDDKTREQQQTHEYAMPLSLAVNIGRRSYEDENTVDYEDAN